MPYVYAAVGSPTERQASVWLPGTPDEPEVVHPGIFVALAANGVSNPPTIADGQYCMTSDNPPTDPWTLQNTFTPHDGPYRDVTYSPDLGLIVGVALGNDLYQSVPGLACQIITSPDGVTWTRRESADGLKWLSCVEWSSELGIFVALSIGNDNASTGTSLGRVQTSEDGITWTAGTPAQDIAWRDLVWSPELSLFAAVANSGTNRVMTSADGITWTTRTPSADNTWNAIAWSPELGLYCAVANTGTNRAMTSPDGINWTGRAIPNQGWIDVIWCPGLALFVACSVDSAQQIATSPDGINWTLRSVPASIFWSALAYDGNVIVCVGQLSGTTNRVMTSPDGINWTIGTSVGTDRNWVAVCFAGVLP